MQQNLIKKWFYLRLKKMFLIERYFRSHRNGHNDFGGCTSRKFNFEKRICVYVKDFAQENNFFNKMQ